MIQTISCIKAVRLLRRMPMWRLCSPIVNQTHFCSMVVSFQIGINTPNRLIMVLATIAVNAILPDLDFLPNTACRTNANSGNSITRMLAIMGDIESAVFTLNLLIRGYAPG